MSTNMEVQKTFYLHSLFVLCHGLLSHPQSRSAIMIGCLSVDAALILVQKKWPATLVCQPRKFHKSNSPRISA